MKKWFQVGNGLQVLLDTQQVRQSVAPSIAGGLLIFGAGSCPNGSFFLPNGNHESAAVVSTFDAALLAPRTGNLQLVAFMDVNSSGSNRRAVLTVGDVGGSDGTDSAMDATIPDGQHIITTPTTLVAVTQGQYLRVRGVTTAAIVNGFWLMQYV